MTSRPRSERTPKLGVVRVVRVVRRYVAAALGLLAPSVLLLGMHAVSQGAPTSEPRRDDDAPRVLVLGDSIMAWNAELGASVANAMGAKLGVEVVSAAVPGARVLAGEDAIGQQYLPGRWDWVVVQGGGNDLVEGCGCGACSGLLDRLLAPDGTSGAIAELVARARGDGASVVLWSYYEMPDDAPFPFGHCNDELVEVRARLLALAQRDQRVWVVDGREVVQPDRADLYDGDRVHPSPAGSRAIGTQLATAVASGLSP